LARDDGVVDIETAINHHCDGESPSREVDGRIAVLAARQHGVVARRQLFGEGIRRGALELRLRNGRLHSVHQGVYAVGHTVLSRKGHWMAAVLAGGQGAPLSHRAAAAIWEIRRSGGAGPIEVTVWPEKHSRPGLRFYARRLLPDEVTQVDGIPVTAPSRTLLDLASVLDPHRLERAVHEAEIHRLAGELSLEDLTDRNPGARGTRALTKILAATRRGTEITRSELEERFLAFLDRAHLPRPNTNHLVEAGVHRYEVDCLWKTHRLIVELDSHATHAPTRSFESDRARDRALHAAGWRVVRVTWHQLHDQPRAIAADLRSLLGPAASLPSS
jgi:hypothetical protein